MENRAAIVSTLLEAKNSPELYRLLKRKVVGMYRRRSNERLKAIAEKV